MKVAILTPRGHGAPGGAERFYAGLVAAFAREGLDAVELPVPVDESSFDRIEEAYVRCWGLDLSSYDMVVSTKAPTFMVRHPRHVCYLVHTIRVFYDMFEVVFPGTADLLHRQRSLVHRLDSLALAAPRVRRVFTIGHEVSRRLREYNGIESEVLHPPLAFDAFREGPPGDYFFLPGRLHPWKRVALAIEAMRHLRHGARLLVAGTGEQEQELRSLAADLPAVQFLGRVSDEELVRLYAGALAVVFPPLREDYGYVTLEAFASAKPVITCSDSGEAAFLVQDGVNGRVVAPEAPALAAAMDELCKHREKAAALGTAGRDFVRALDWRNVVHRLLAA